MDSLLQNNLFLFYIVTLIFTSVAGLKRTERIRVALVYIFSIAMAVAHTISPWYVIVGATTVLFILLEILSDDVKRIQLFTKPKHKLIDFLYRIIFEYYYPLFVISVAVLAIRPRHPYLDGIYAVSVILVLIALALLMSQKYSTKSITGIVDRLESRLAYYQMPASPEMTNMFSILVDLEDREFFYRKEDQHSIPLHKFFTKGWSYLKKHKGVGVILAFKSLFRRGYGTIEMQLIRTIGVDGGYDSVYKRKVFEFLYANMLFNSYRIYLRRAGNNPVLYRDFLIRQYIENAPVKINAKTYYPNGQSTLLQLFKKGSIEDISKEQFFVWCIGLTWSYMGPYLVNAYSSFLDQHNIDSGTVKEILEKL